MTPFSILVAFYNNYEYFTICYKSLQNQTFKDFEIVIVDDCSEPEQVGLLKNLLSKDPRARIYSNDKNRGVGFTKSRCVALAKGEICGFVDPDDALEKDALERSIARYNDKSIIATYSQMYFCDENLKVEKIYEKTRGIKAGNPLFFNIHFEISHFFTFRRSAYLKTDGILQDYKVAEDMDIYLKLYEIGEIGFINKPLYYYRIHNKGLSHDDANLKKKRADWDKVLRAAAQRRGIKRMYGRNVDEIEDVPKFIFEKENTFLRRLKRKLKKIIA